MLFATEVIGGIVLGCALGYLGLKLVKYIENEHVELEVLITLSLVLLVTVLANEFHLSGPLGVVMMGLFLNRNIDTDKIENKISKKTKALLIPNLIGNIPDWKKIKKIALVTGWSMAGCQSYQWAAQYPDMVKAILPFCASSKTSIHNHVFFRRS